MCLLLVSHKNLDLRRSQHWSDLTQKQLNHLLMIRRRMRNKGQWRWQWLNIRSSVSSSTPYQKKKEKNRHLVPSATPGEQKRLKNISINWVSLFPLSLSLRGSLKPSVFHEAGTGRCARAGAMPPLIKPSRLAQPIHITLLMSQFLRLDHAVRYRQCQGLCGTTR